MKRRKRRRVLIFNITVQAQITDAINPDSWAPMARAIGIALERRGALKREKVSQAPNMPQDEATATERGGWG